MGTTKIAGVVLLVVGVVLLYFGIQATDAPLEQARETFTGDYSEQTMVYLIGGAAAAVGGLLLVLFGRRR
jgi:putative Mn2+ efflux pump MntP